MTYEEVFAEVLALRGEGALASAGVLVGCAMDVSGAEWQRENRVLSRVLDDEALEPFSRAETPEGLAAAHASLRARLVGEECLSEAVAEAICGGLAGGIASWRGFGEAPGGGGGRGTNGGPSGTVRRTTPDAGAQHVLPDGSVYEGGWEDDAPSGSGKMWYPDGNTYDGEWRDGVRSGHGRCTWSDGSVYEGEWRDDAPSGNGRMTWSDGRSYDGEWRRGIRVGRGRMTWPDGFTYEGEWRDGKLDLALANVDPIPPQAYTGGPITPEPVVRQGGRTLENGRDYTLAYYANVGSPTATSEARVVVKHTVSGKYAGEKAVSFKIVPQQADTAKRSDDDNADRKTCGCGCLWLSLSALFWIIMIGEVSRGNEGVANAIFYIWFAVTVVLTPFV